MPKIMDRELWGVSLDVTKVALAMCSPFPIKGEVTHTGLTFKSYGSLLGSNWSKCIVSPQTTKKATRSDGAPLKPEAVMQEAEAIEMEEISAGLPTLCFSEN